MSSMPCGRSSRTRASRARGVALLTGLLMCLSAPAHAQEVTPARGVREVERARSLVERSVTLYRQGRPDAAYETARSAYLDHFEFVEIPLRVRDETLTLDLEERFANLRNAIQAGAPLGDVRAISVEVQEGLDTVERRLSAPGVVAPLIAVGASFVVLFREGLEAVLVVAAVLGYLEASRNQRYRGAVLRGVAGAGIATLVTFVVATVVLTVAPVQREVLEAATAVAAVAVLFYVSFWLVARLEQRRWMEFVKARVWAAASTGSTLALAGVGFTAVYREGFETVLFYQALLTFTRGLEEWVALGAALAAAVLGGVGAVIFRAGRRVPVRAFLTAAVVLIMALSVAFVGNAVRALQEAALAPVTRVSLPNLPIFLADLTGYHPTRETLAAQALLALVYVAGGVWTFVIAPRRARAVTAAASRDLPPARGELPDNPGDVPGTPGGPRAASEPERAGSS